MDWAHDQLVIYWGYVSFLITRSNPWWLVVPVSYLTFLLEGCFLPKISNFLVLFFKTETSLFINENKWDFKLKVQEYYTKSKSKENLDKTIFGNIKYGNLWIEINQKSNE